MSETLKCDCGGEYFIPLYQLERNDKGEVISSHNGVDFVCAICHEIHTFYTKK